MKEYLKPNLIFVFSIVALLPVMSLFVEKGSVVLFVNSFSSELLDCFFLNWTRLGEVVPYVVVGLIVFFKYRHLFYRYIFTIALQMIVALVLKWLVFSSCPRPISWFSENDWAALHKVDGFIHGHYNAFPSGHTMAAFVVFSFVILHLSKSTVLNFILLFGALLVALSRIYLLQHFYVDVAYGAFLGMICGICSIFVPEKYKYTK